LPPGYLFSSDPYESERKLLHDNPVDYLQYYYVCPARLTKIFYHIGCTREELGRMQNDKANKNGLAEMEEILKKAETIEPSLKDLISLELVLEQEEAKEFASSNASPPGLSTGNRCTSPCTPGSRPSTR
jgi:hypothetical protein